MSYKVKVGELKTVILEALNEASKDSGPWQKVAIVHTGQNGRDIEVDGEWTNTYDLAIEQDPNLESLLDFENDEDEEEFEKAVERIEFQFLKQHGITHIVDIEVFHDEKPHPLNDWLKHGLTASDHGFDSTSLH